MSTMMMARTTMPMPMVLAGDALADCPKRSYTPTRLLGALGDRGLFMRHLLARKAPGETS
jgi:hypothetical protein